jgi:hypothetical protein
VPKIATNTIGRIFSAPATPFCASSGPNADAVAPATMPRGAIHATNARSCLVKDERNVASATAPGRMIRIMTATSTIACGNTDLTSSGETDAATSTNSTPMSSWTSVSSNSKSERLMSRPR